MPPAQPTITSLFIYPVKSCQGISLASAPIVGRGLEHDRRWMVVDPLGGMLSQREAPQMARILTSLRPEGIRLSADRMEDLVLPYRHEDGERVDVKLWNEGGAGLRHERAGAWMSRALGRPCGVVWMPDDHLRRLKPSRGRPEDHVSFVDGYSFLLVTEASIADVERRCGLPLDVRRFRPSVVVSGFAPFVEDAWTVVRLGAVRFRVVKLCTRCVMLNIDPETAAAGKEPLRTLAGFRSEDGKVRFGLNLQHDGLGVLSVGDAVSVG